MCLYGHANKALCCTIGLFNAETQPQVMKSWKVLSTGKINIQLITQLVFLIESNVW